MACSALSIWSEGVDADGFHGDISVRPRMSFWKNATVVAAGAFAANDRANDIMVRWASGAVSLYPGVDAAGTHTEIQLAH